MEINDNEVEGAMQTIPTMGSQVLASTASHSQNESVPIEANEATLNNTLDAEISGTDVGTKRKCRSIAWDHFEKKLIGGKWKAICNDCKKTLGGDTKNGTKHLLDHMKICLHKKQKTIQQSLLQPAKSNDGIMQLGTYHFNQDQARTELANMIILHEYPLSMVDHVGFRRYSHALQPIFKVVSRNTIKTDIMKIFEYERNKTMKLLDSNVSRIALTTEMWTASNQQRGFMAIASHFIDVSWKLQSRLVRFIYVPCPHTAEVLANALVDCLLDWNLDRKLSTLTVDNCTTNDAMIELILDKLPPSSLILEGKLFHMRCCAHILNLVVRDGLELISDSIETIRYSVAFWTATPKRDEKFIETARQLKVPSTKKLELDCKTRWNSTYLMLNTALEYEAVFARLKQRETLYKRVPTQEDWSKVREISSKLEMFFDATELFSGTKYPTINLFFSTICDIKLAIGDWLLSDDNVVKTMATNMKVKFEKYWDVMNCLLAIGSILDLRYKMKTVQFYYPLVYGDMSSYEIEKLKKKLCDMVEEYEKKSKQSQKVKNSQSSSSLRPPLPKRGTYADKFEMFMDSNNSTEHEKSDLDYYLEESLLPRTSEFDILCWWKTNGIKYPILHDIAKDVLAIPVTTVASESTFSTSGRILNAHRSRLHSKTIEALMCARDWLWSEIQDSTISIDQKFDNDADIEEPESSRTITDSNSIEC
ncbi:zinc finger BED domain-containing protein RICESLEEPER 2-like [Zingiber officinale]|uniref:zinc finger BED domain-containing protein RICESLEEPER 2-like n=1 Tax=Zingiber officinale TaxID=94328 RepID=UPI001C4B44FA|nr:zinc finger BED domain-containing protein RICESLEEPER 2-like [Zingiber officinale]